MLEWFNMLTSEEQIFWIIAVFSTAVFFFVLIGTFFGNKNRRDLDFGTGFRFFKFRNCVAFFFVFSWLGIACLYQNISLTMSLVIAISGGLVMMFVMVALYYYVKKMKESSTLEYKNELNSKGKVNQDIGKLRSYTGKVIINGDTREHDAVTDFEHDITEGTLIRVESVTENGILIVKPLQ